MKDLDKQITDGAKKYNGHRIAKQTFDDHYDAFIAGAKSPAAKEFHQQGMYSEEEVKRFLYNLWEADDDDFEIWFNENKKK